MPKQILCLSGWGQKSDSLKVIFSDKVFDPFFVTFFDYLKFNKAADFFSSIESANKNPEILLGWSLGGQLAVRLVEKGIFKPKLLILIAPPFQMIKDSRIQAAMARATFDKFYENFSQAPDRTLKQFAILTAMNDRHSAEIARSLDIHDQNFSQLQMWLEELARFSCFDIDFSKMPRTILLQGAGDMIVHSSQAEYFRQRVSNFRLEIFKNCGHAPHLSDADRVRKIIFEEINQL